MVLAIVLAFSMFQAVFQLLESWPKFFGRIWVVFSLQTRISFRVFVRLTSDTGVKRSLWWKVKQCQRKANGGRCVAGGKLMGNTSRQSKSGWRWILCWKGKQVVKSPFQNGNVNLPSINIRHGFGECTQLTGENWILEDEFPFVKVQFSRVHVKGECETSKPTPELGISGMAYCYDGSSGSSTLSEPASKLCIR